MIESRNRRLMINGIGSQTATVYKAPDGALKQGRGWVVADGQGGGRQPTYVLGASGTPSGVAWASAALVSGVGYDLSGTVVPAGFVVHLSRAGGAAGPEELAEGEFAAVPSDAMGAWSYDGLTGFDGTLYAWVLIPAAVLGAMGAYVSCSLSAAVRQTVEETGVRYASVEAVQRSDPNVAANHWDYAQCTITGTAPAGVEAVYVSEDMGDISAETAQELTPCVVATAQPDSEGAYTVDVTDYFDGVTRYVVWCRSETGTLTASMTWAGGMCLSGDTRITMADGGVKRLDEVRPGDLLLAGDGTPARALRVARGQWNDHHTLYRFDDGTVIDEVHDHRFYNVECGFWQLLGRWKPGQHARRQDGAQVALTAVERVDEPAEMFGLWTASRDYWANGLLSGETAANQALLADATAEQAAEMAASLEERAVLRLLRVEEMLP